MNVVSFSGGKDSTAMLLMMLEKGIQVDRVICVDTTKEFPAMYRHIEKVQAICPVKIEIVETDFDYWFAGRVKTKGKNIGDVGYGWPGPLSRWCTKLKTALIQKQLPKERIEYIGFSLDEKNRADKLQDTINVQYKFPLIEWGITEKQALEYCYSNDFDWEGLYEKFHRVSCWLCPLQPLRCLKTLHNDFPELWQELIEMDKKSLRKFRADYSVEQLTARFENENKQMGLFKDVANNGIAAVPPLKTKGSITETTEDFPPYMGGCITNTDPIRVSIAGRFDHILKKHAENTKHTVTEKNHPIHENLDGNTNPIEDT